MNNDQLNDIRASTLCLTRRSIFSTGDVTIDCAMHYVSRQLSHGYVTVGMESNSLISIVSTLIFKLDCVKN